MFEKLTDAEITILNDIIGILDNITHLDTRTLKPRIGLDWVAKTQAQRRALWRLGQRAFLEVTTSLDYGYKAREGESFSAFGLLPGFWQWVGLTPETIVVNNVYANMRAILNELENGDDYQYSSELPQYRIDTWQIMMQSRDPNLVVDHAVAWNLERQRIANNRRIQESELQLCENFLARLEVRS